MNTRIDDATTIGLNNTAHEKLRALKDDGYFAEMQDAFRFAFGLAISRGVNPTTAQRNAQRTTVFNVGTLDPDGEMRAIVALLLPEHASSPYKAVESLAESGIYILSDMATRGYISLSDFARP